MPAPPSAAAVLLEALGRVDQEQLRRDLNLHAYVINGGLLDLERGLDEGADPNARRWNVWESIAWDAKHRMETEVEMPEERPTALIRLLVPMGGDGLPARWRGTHAMSKMSPYDFRRAVVCLLEHGARWDVPMPPNVSPWHLWTVRHHDNRGYHPQYTDRRVAMHDADMAFLADSIESHVGLGTGASQALMWALRRHCFTAANALRARGVAAPEPKSCEGFLALWDADTVPINHARLHSWYESSAQYLEGARSQKPTRAQTQEAYVGHLVDWTQTLLAGVPAHALAQTPVGTWERAWMHQWCITPLIEVLAHRGIDGLERPEGGVSIIDRLRQALVERVPPKDLQASHHQGFAYEANERVESALQAYALLATLSPTSKGARTRL